jgi:hypothetical protein
MPRHECGEGSDRGELGDGSEGILEVDTWALGEALGNEASLVLDDNSALVLLGFEDKLGPDRSMASGDLARRDALECVWRVLSLVTSLLMAPLPESGLDGLHCLAVGDWVQ